MQNQFTRYLTLTANTLGVIGLVLLITGWLQKHASGTFLYSPIFYLLSISLILHGIKFLYSLVQSKLYIDSLVKLHIIITIFTAFYFFFFIANGIDLFKPYAVRYTDANYNINLYLFLYWLALILLLFQMMFPIHLFLGMMRKRG